jgi:hypothetical protein
VIIIGGGAACGRAVLVIRWRLTRALRLAWAGHRRSLALPYIVGIPETCMLGSSHGNQIANAPIATSNTPGSLAERLPVAPEFLSEEAGLSPACRMDSDEIRLLQDLGGDDGGREPVDAA